MTTVIVGCSSPVPDLCKRANVRAMFACEEGNIVLQYNNGDFLVIDENNKETRCTKGSTDFCKKHEDTEYCPRFNYCTVGD